MSENLEVKLAKLESSIDYMKDKVDKIMEAIEKMPQCYLTKESFEYEKDAIHKKINDVKLQNNSTIKNIKRIVTVSLAIITAVASKIFYDIIIALLHHI